MIVILLLLIALSIALSLIFTPAVRKLALRWNLVDLPDHKRKVHKKPIPRVGGIALTAAYFGSCFAVVALLSRFHVDGFFGFTAIKSITPATLFVFFIGLLDDMFTLKAWQKFVAQLVAGMLVVSAGVHIGGFSIFTAYPLFGKVITVVWLVACTNAVNLIDGLDGLAAGIALLATMTTLVASLINGHVELTVATVPLAGALIGFLVFNFNPASIFLGDSGSLVLGFLLGCYSILWSSKCATPLGMTAPLIALSVPLLDTTLAIARRFLRAQPIFKPDRSHIHHRLLARGLTHRRTVLLLYVASAVAGTFSLALIWARNHWESAILLTFGCAAIYCIRELSYAEFEAARRVLLRGSFRREINVELAVQTFEAGLDAAATPDDCWAIVERVSHEFGFRATRMRFVDRMFGVQNRGDGARSSAIAIAISENDWVELSLGADSVQHPNALVPFATTMRRVLADKRIVMAYSPQRQTETAFTT
ncbi:MAG: undecaprenyl/decaprenyl-phosphate alpha-N-acetylglucosaminyl 1-phosphate transferase, partial [Acidobacteriaceae bacterium]|nr:undecaprenyl/decaprenyl-phosphate alpha-N-acetylglucosaminyl 1-phosphate transferase [Acidobacteriaceae bacterium]